MGLKFNEKIHSKHLFSTLKPGDCFLDYFGNICMCIERQYLARQPNAKPGYENPVNFINLKDGCLGCYEPNLHVILVEVDATITKV